MPKFLLITFSAFFFFCFPVISLFRHFVNSSVLAYSDQVYFIHQDHLGSVIAVTDEAGNVVSETKYSPYGSPAMKQWSNEAMEETPPTERAYTGQLRDSSTALSYYNARYYDPVISRFTSADSAGGGNRFAYVGGNPVMASDPSGNKEEEGGGVQENISKKDDIYKRPWFQKMELIPEVEEELNVKFNGTWSVREVYAARNVMKRFQFLTYAYNTFTKSMGGEVLAYGGSTSTVGNVRLFGGKREKLEPENESVFNYSSDEDRYRLGDRYTLEFVLAHELTHNLIYNNGISPWGRGRPSYNDQELEVELANQGITWRHWLPEDFNNINEYQALKMFQRGEDVDVFENHYGYMTMLTNPSMLPTDYSKTDLAEAGAEYGAILYGKYKGKIYDLRADMPYYFPGNYFIELAKRGRLTDE